METANGPTTLTTVLPGAVFGPILDAENLGSVQVIGRMLRGRMPGTLLLCAGMLSTRACVALATSSDQGVTWSRTTLVARTGTYTDNANSTANGRPT